MNLAGRKIVGGLFLIVGTAFFIWGIGDISKLAGSAQSFRLHHEVTTPLCYLICKICFGLLSGSIAAYFLNMEKNLGINLLIDGQALLFLSVLLIAAGLVLENEAFFTLYDNKSLPVHPTEIVMHPKSGWMTVGDHLLTSIIGIIGIALFLVVTKEKK